MSGAGTAGGAAAAGAGAGVIAGLRGRLIVSCQAPEGSPLRDPAHLAALAAAAQQGGAAAIRAEGAASIAAIRAAVSVPIVGLRKRAVEGSGVYITPAVEDALAMRAAGADVVAVDATLRDRPGGEGPEAFLARLRAALGDDVELLADVDTVEAGVRAAVAGADAVATTLSGYTAATANGADGPDLALLRALVAAATIPVIAEGRYGSPDDVAAGFAAGAHAVVVGTAITDALALTRRFAAATPGA
jgi:N-acylglucosamine-6-phosphate 2-epimerase